MDNDLKSRIGRRLKELGLSAIQASRDAGGSDSLLQNILSGKSRSLRSDFVEPVARVLQVSASWLLTGEGDSPAPAAGAPRDEFRLAPDAVPPQRNASPKDVPVMGTVAGSELGRGAFQLTSDVVDYVRRPAGLMGAKDVYALYVEGDSMVPRFEPGDLVFVHPHRKPRGGDYVVIQEPDSNNGEPRGFIKRLVGITAKLIRTEQFNPKANLDFINRPGTVLHKVLTDGELYGV